MVILVKGEENLIKTFIEMFTFICHSNDTVSNNKIVKSAIGHVLMT